MGISKIIHKKYVPDGKELKDTKGDDAQGNLLSKEALMFPLLMLTGARYQIPDTVRLLQDEKSHLLLQLLGIHMSYNNCVNVHFNVRIIIWMCIRKRSLRVFSAMSCKDGWLIRDMLDVVIFLVHMLLDLSPYSLYENLKL